MVNYYIGTTVTAPLTPEEAAAEIEAALELIVNASGIFTVQYIPQGNGSKVVGIAQYENG